LLVLIPTKQSSQNIEAGGYFTASGAFYQISFGALTRPSLTKLKYVLKEQKRKPAFWAGVGFIGW
jgi:hypothetical protein